MSGFLNKDLQVGDILETEAGGIYAYLGYFEGRPHSMYLVPDCGHMYLFLDRWAVIKNGITYGPTVREAASQCDENSIMLSTEISSMLLQNNLCRLRYGIDGNARYTKSYINFKRRVGHVEIPDREKVFYYVYGCRRLGDKKPRGYKG